MSAGGLVVLAYRVKIDLKPGTERDLSFLGRVSVPGCPPFGRRIVDDVDMIAFQVTCLSPSSAWSMSLKTRQ
ncbi:hypothetical protein X751_17270 [Mesorhizobium sp. LNJC395A00]|nr:hypothetical protein X751_17270 [Mesorhizobium sp. LNJC395A00]